jgi:surface polysaccharide O-acyltransferase-like enzyme
MLSIIAFAILYQANYLTIFKNQIVGKILAYLSSLTFGVYLVHVLILIIVDRFVPILPGTVSEPMWIYVLGKFVVVVMLSYLLAALLRKLPFSRYLVA